MPHLAIDIGNTAIKTGVFDGISFIEKHIFRSISELESWAKHHSISSGILCTVGNQSPLQLEFPLLQFGSEEVKIPLANLYKTPETLGKDRLAGAIGAKALFPDQPCLIIDMGTCITYDFVTTQGEYLGGAIAPGLHMRFKSLNHYTARLPLIDTPMGDVEMIGNDTFTSIQSGVVNGIKYELEGTIKEYTAKHPYLKVLLCGGDAEFFESIIKGDIFAFPDLVLHGLNHTLLYNNAHH